MAFIFGDITRSYVSCISSVVQVRVFVAHNFMVYKPIKGFYQTVANFDFAIVKIDPKYKIAITFSTKVGLVMSVLGAAEIISTFGFNRLAPKLGRNFFMVIVFVMEGGVLLFCWLWKPSSNQSWVPFVLAFVIGIPDGLRQTLVLGTNMTNKFYFIVHATRTVNQLKLNCNKFCIDVYRGKPFFSSTSAFL